MSKREIPEINAGSMADIAFLLLIFFLVTTTMDKETAYIRQIPKKIESDIIPPPIQQRNVCAIKANNNNELLFRGKPMKDPDEISEKIVEFYRMNEGISDAEAQARITCSGCKEANYPFYSYISKAKLNAAIDKAEKEMDETADNPAASKDLKKFKEKQFDDWLKKSDALSLYGKSGLPEIDVQAHIRVEVMAKTEYELFAKIQSEIEEAIYELRDDAAEDVFGESYGVIKQRFANDVKDQAKDGRKIDLLKVLYPDRIIEVKPK